MIASEQLMITLMIAPEQLTITLMIASEQLMITLMTIARRTHDRARAERAARIQVSALYIAISRFTISTVAVRIATLIGRATESYSCG